MTDDDIKLLSRLVGPASKEPGIGVHAPLFSWGPPVPVGAKVRKQERKA